MGRCRFALGLSKDYWPLDRLWRLVACLLHGTVLDRERATFPLRIVRNRTVAFGTISLLFFSLSTHIVRPTPVSDCVVIERLRKLTTSHSTSKPSSPPQLSKMACDF